MHTLTDTHKHNLPSTGSLLKCPLQLGLGQAKARSMELCVGTPRALQGHIYLGHLLLPSQGHSQSRKQSSPDSDRCSNTWPRHSKQWLHLLCHKAFADVHVLYADFLHVISWETEHMGSQRIHPWLEVSNPFVRILWPSRSKEEMQADDCPLATNPAYTYGSVLPSAWERNAEQPLIHTRTHVITLKLGYKIPCILNLIKRRGAGIS